MLYFPQPTLVQLAMVSLFGLVQPHLHWLHNHKFNFSAVDDTVVIKAINIFSTKAVGKAGLSIYMIKLCSPFIVSYFTHTIHNHLLFKHISRYLKQL